MTPTTGFGENQTLYLVIMLAALTLGVITFVMIRKGSKDKA